VHGHDVPQPLYSEVAGVRDTGLPQADYNEGMAGLWCHAPRTARWLILAP